MDKTIKIVARRIFYRNCIRRTGRGREDWHHSHFETWVEGRWRVFRWVVEKKTSLLPACLNPRNDWHIGPGTASPHPQSIVWNSSVSFETSSWKDRSFLAALNRWDHLILILRRRYEAPSSVCPQTCCSVRTREGSLVDSSDPEDFLIYAPNSGGLRRPLHFTRML